MRDRESVDIDGAAPSREANVLVRFAGFILDLDGCTLSRESGEAIPLTRGELALLRFFATHPGRVLSRDTLLDATAGRRFGPFDRSVDVMVGRLRRKIEPDAKAPRLIVTVPGGYQFAAAVRKVKPTVEPEPKESAEPGAPAPPAVVPLLEKSGPPRLSLVVLPFANMGGDPEQEYFVDGVTESLTTDLSRISGAFVIARNTAFTYKGGDVKQIGRELNVRYVLEGSVQRRDNRMRVNVQLVDAETAAHLWAERFDKPVSDLFNMQDEIVARLANQLQAELIEAEARRAERSPSPDSIDLVFQGRAMLNRGTRPDILSKARDFFERALQLDPANIDALVGIALADFHVGIGYMIDDPRPLMAAAEAKLSVALAAAPGHAGAHWVMGMVLCSTRRAPRGMEELERALAIDPNMARARAHMALAYVYAGRAEEAEAQVLEAMRLSPRDTLAYRWLLHVGAAKLDLGEYEEAIPWLKRSIDANRNNPWAFFRLAACLAQLGRIDEAHQEVQAGLTVNPKFTIKRFRAGVQSENPIHLAQRERVVEGMRMAGVPEE
jgi:TolB-like protein/thioredoxin-like negative regulator of GroEL